MNANKYSKLNLEEKVEIEKFSKMTLEEIECCFEKQAQKKINEETLRKGRPVKIGNLKPRF